MFHNSLVIMTDDHAAEYRSIKTTFPETLQWIATFYVLQAIWQWLRYAIAKHGISQNDRTDYSSLGKYDEFPWYCNPPEEDCPHMTNTAECVTFFKYVFIIHIILWSRWMAMRVPNCTTSNELNGKNIFINVQPTYFVYIFSYLSFIIS